MSKKRISPLPKWEYKYENRTINDLSFVSDAKFLALSLSDGQISLHSPITGALSYTLTQSPDGYPSQSIKFNPIDSKLLLSSSVDGTINEWTTVNPKVIWTTKEEKNEIYTLNIAATGKLFATAGSDRKIRIYDYDTKGNINILSGTKSLLDEIPCHKNKIFGLIFDNDDSNRVISGGWDDSLHIWDLRTKSSIHQLFGSHLCSNSIDISGNMLLVGAWQARENIKLYDIRMLSCLKNITWKDPNAEGQNLIYAAKIHQSGKFFVVGSSGLNQVGTFSTLTGSQICDPIKFPSEVYSLSFTEGGNCLAVGRADGILSSHEIHDAD